MKKKDRLKKLKQEMKPKVEINKKQFPNFKKWLIDQGATISEEKNKGEAIRFYINKKCGLIYNTLTANSVGHEMSSMYVWINPCLYKQRMARYKKQDIN